jgi:diguanylate cyclase (GGDEF)-like protein
MSDKNDDVLLITSDPELREQICRRRPPHARLCCLAPEELRETPIPSAVQFWMDLDCAAEPVGHPVERRVYFYSTLQRPTQSLPPGLFVRKPCTASVLEVLWAGVRPVDEQTPTERADAATSGLPAWLPDFQELSLTELCRKIVTRLPACLGYSKVSLYLHEAQPRVLSLAETNHTRAIDLTVRTNDANKRLMAAVAETGRPLITEDVERAYQAHSVRRPRYARRYRDRACVVAPLLAAGQLQGVLNLSGRQSAEQGSLAFPWHETLAFLGRALDHARRFEQARTEARIDNLTGLFNRRWFVETLEKEIHRARRFANPLALILIDLDELKLINDRHGHLAGDAVLRHVARRIVAALRQIDSAARMGGDEFVVVLPTTDLTGARQVGQRILDAIRDDAPLFRDVPVPVTASLGVARLQADWGTDELLEATDKTMYAAKRQGRNCLACHAYEHRQPARGRFVPHSASTPTS